MTAFTVWKFDDPAGATQAEKLLESAAKHGLITVVDHAVVSWPEGAEQPETQHSNKAGRTGAGWGAVWGLLGGTLFLLPVLGAAFGAGIGALAKALEGTGISKDDLERIRQQVVPGTSALFVVSENAHLDRLGDRLTLRDSTLIHTDLTDAERRILLESFGG